MSPLHESEHQPKPAYRIIHASRMLEQSGGIDIYSRAPDGDSIEAAAGAWAGYGALDFSGGWNLCMAYAAADKGGRMIEVRIDSPTGERIGTFTVPATGTADLFREQDAPVSPVRGVHDLFLVFPDGPVGFDGFIFSMDSEQENSSQRAERMGWWRGARFGRFIHWGPYAVLGRGEWAMYRENWPSGGV